MPPSSCDRLVDDRAAMRGRSDIARDQDRLAPCLFHEPLRFLRIFVLVKIGDKDVCALPRIRDSNRPPDSAVRTRDHRLLPGELATAAVALFAVIGLGPHLVGASRHRLVLARERRFGVLLHGRDAFGLNNCRASTAEHGPMFRRARRRRFL